MADTDSRTQITIAVIGLVGVLTAALIANWDKIFVKAPPVPVTHTSVGTPPAGDPKATPKDGQKNAADLKTGPKGDAKQDSLGDAPDSVMIVSSSPSPDTSFTAGEIVQFTINVRYRLTTLEKATLSVEVLQFPHSNDCSGSGNTPATGKVPITRGEDNITVSIPWTVGLSKSVTKTGSVALGASFWSDMETRQMFRNFGPRPGYCFQLD